MKAHIVAQPPWHAALTDSQRPPFHPPKRQGVDALQKYTLVLSDLLNSLSVQRESCDRSLAHSREGKGKPKMFPKQLVKNRRQYVE